MTRKDFKGFKANCEDRKTFEEYTQYCGFAFLQLTAKQSNEIYDVLKGYYGETVRTFGVLGEQKCVTTPCGMSIFRV